MGVRRVLLQLHAAGNLLHMSVPPLAIDALWWLGCIVRPLWARHETRGWDLQ